MQSPSLALVVGWLFTALAPTVTPLPLNTVVFYENGVGYFERRGVVKAGSLAEIPLEAGQLDDALKSFVVVSERGVGSVEYAPPLQPEAARAKAGLPEPDESAGSMDALLRAMQGVDVVVTRRDGARVSGRVVGVTEEKAGHTKEGEEIVVATLVVFGDEGLQKVAMPDVEGVKPASTAVAGVWSRAVGATVLQPSRDRLLVRAGGDGGQVAVGYTTEAPVWRTTYRLLVDERARVQGFALVHNDSDEAWSNVKVTFASGRPTSFLYPLAGPRYGRRDLVTPEDGLDTAPQLTSAEARDHLRGALAQGSFGVGGLGLRGSGMGGSGSGEGHGAMTVGHGGLRGIRSVVLEDGPTPLPAAAVSEAGDFFLYTARDLLTLGAHRSALVPILDETIGAEAVTVVDEGLVPSLGVRVKNDTDLVLEGGTVSVFTEGIYAGETQLDRVKPGEVRVLTHGEDIDLVVSGSTESAEGAPRRVEVNGVEGARALVVTRVDRTRRRLSFTSRADTERQVLVRLGDEGHLVVSGAVEDERSPGQPRYGRIALAAHAAQEVEIVEDRGVSERVSAEVLSSKRIDAWLALGPTDDVRRVLTRVRAVLVAAEAEEARAAQLEARAQELDEGIVRVRADLDAVGRGGARNAAQTLGDKLVALEAERTGLQTQRDAALQAARDRRSKLARAE